MHPLILAWITVYLEPAISEARGIQPALIADLAPNRKNQLAALKHLKWVLTQDRFQAYFNGYMRAYRQKNRSHAPFLMYEMSEMLECTKDELDTESQDYTWAENKRSVFNDIAHMMRAGITLVSQFGGDIAAEIRDEQ